MLEGVHRRINIWATCPVIQKILLCGPPSPQTMLLPWQLASPNQSLLRASQLTPSWVLSYTWFTQPHVLDSHKADVHRPSEVAGWLWGQKCKLQGRRAWVESLGQLCEFVFLNLIFQKIANLSGLSSLFCKMDTVVCSSQGCCKGWLRNHSNTSRYLAQSAPQ